jgi:hypothetical protein
MSDPEIDRRCTGCGASVRSQALFCPQCGQSIPNQTSTNESPELKTRILEDNPTLKLTRNSAPDPSETQPLSAMPDLSVTQPLIPVSDAVPEHSTAPKQANLQRATNVARGIEENVLGRVEKIRKVSSVVIDQAAYDPSLRFLLVAAFLFFLFLFLLIMSKVLG